MATYSNIGIKLITTGDESGTWGTSTNTNFSDVLDEAIAGAVTYNISSDADFTLTVSDGTSSDARHAVIKFTSTTLTATRVCTFAPNTLQKTWVVINATTGGQSLTFKQGSAGNTVTVPNGESAIIYSDGAGATNGAVVRVLDSFTNTKITTGTLNATTLDLTNLEVTNIKAKDGTAALTIADSTGKVTVSTELAVDNINVSGNAITSTDTNGNIDLTPNGTGEVNITKVDIDSGAIDGTAIGANSASTGAFTTLSASSTTNLNPANANVSVAPTGTGTVTINPATAGTMNNVAIGGSTPAAGTFTTLTSSSTVTVNGGTANQVQYLNASKQQVGSANLTFDGTTLTAANFADSSLTSGRVTYAGASGNLTDSSALTFDGTTLATTTVDATNVEVTNIKAKDGTAAASIADSTGVISVTSNPVLSGGTANGVLYLNGSKVATSGSAVTYDGTTFATTGAANFATSSGNVGIGTSSPAEKLTVAGNIRLNGNQAVIFQQNSGVAAGTISFRNSSGVQKAAIGSYYNIADEGDIEFISSTGGTNMVLNSSGNLGLGVTPSAWSTLTALQMPVGGLAGYSGAATNKQFHFLNNAYYGASGWTYRESDYAQRLTTVNGQYQFYIAPQGTAGNAITFTQALTLNANGALVLQGGDTTANGVGVTFPATQSASSNANTLDDYEEGTWTPGITFGGSSSGITYTEQVGRYTKVGRLITLQFAVILLNKGAATGAALVTGVPSLAYALITAGGRPLEGASVQLEGGGSSWPANSYGLVWNDGNVYLRYNDGTSWAAVTNSNFTNSTAIYMTVTYEIA